MLDVALEFLLDDNDADFKGSPSLENPDYPLIDAYSHAVSGVVDRVGPAWTTCCGPRGPSALVVPSRSIWSHKASARA